MHDDHVVADNTTHGATDRAPTRQITLVCEVLTGPARSGRFVGRVEVVATGEVVPIRDLHALLDLVRRLSLDM